MELLLDTHIVLWFFGDVEKLSESSSNAIFDPENDKWISIVSVWELAIKIGTGKLQFEGGVSELFHLIRKNGFGLLPITEEHVKRLETLPLLHRDPFDRMLIAQSLTEDMPFVSCDEAFDPYGVRRLW
jgi:PIN domain nuclease of toxin-antitoxin system